MRAVLVAGLRLAASPAIHNAGQITRRLPDAPVDSLRLLFDPAIVAKSRFR